MWDVHLVTVDTLLSHQGYLKVDPEDEIHRFYIKLMEEAQNNRAILEHLLASLQIVYGEQKTLKIVIDLGFGLTMVQKNSSVT